MPEASFAVAERRIIISQSRAGRKVNGLQSRNQGNIHLTTHYIVIIIFVFFEKMIKYIEYILCIILLFAVIYSMVNKM